MGRKSKRRGKNKRGGKQRSPGTDNAEKKPLDTMQLFENSMRLIRGGNTKEKGLEIKAQRDEFEEEKKSCSPEDLKGVDEVHLDLAHILVANMTLTMAQCGLVEEGKHSSIVYAEEHADKLFADGGEKFFQQWKDATDKAKLEQKKRNEMEKMINDGDTEGQMRILQDLMRTVDKVQNDRRIEQGLPPMPENDNPFHNTILDDELFHPCPPRPDCPVCFLPLPQRNETCYQPCCGKTLCDGCIFAHRDAKNASGEEICCPFCRDSIATTDIERIKKTEERLKHGDREAFFMLGARYYEGMPPFKQNRKKGLELLNQAAEFGSEAAHLTLGLAHYNGVGVKKNDKKVLYHLRLAAIGGMLESRYFLGQAFLEGNPKNPELAYKHFLIAAEAGHDESLKEVKTGYTKGHVEKDVFEKVLRAHKAAKKEVKSEARDKAAQWYRRQSSGN